MPYVRSKTRATAVSEGYRSGFEQRISDELSALGIDFKYEEEKLKYEVPAKLHSYTPDFLLPNGIYVETKGRWTLEDRQKMKLVIEQNRDKDIRMVFQSGSTKISKNSKTTYGQWADKLGIQWATRHIPQEWIDEPSKK